SLGACRCCWCLVLIRGGGVGILGGTNLRNGDGAVLLDDLDVLGCGRVDADLGQRLSDGRRVTDLALVEDQHAQQLREGRFLVPTLGVDRFYGEDLYTTAGQGQQRSVEHGVGTTP